MTSLRIPATFDVADMQNHPEFLAKDAERRASEGQIDRAQPVAWRSTQIGCPVEWTYTDDVERVEWLRARSAGYILEPLYNETPLPHPCTCHPSEAPVPCQQKYAYSECVRAAAEPQP